MDIIRPLDAKLQNRLRSGVAATSVAQCVEELVLNAIDASATCVAVRVSLESGHLQVVDNGHGMSRDNMEQVAHRYATSKCHHVKDLENLGHYGYRGEALASIRDTSLLLEITSRHKLSTMTYTRLFRNGHALPVQESSTPRPSPGSTVTVQDVFHALPVRKKNMNAALELERVRTRVEALALIHPMISLSLRNNETAAKLLQTHKSNGVSGSFCCLFGAPKSRYLKDIEASVNGLEIGGFISTESHHSKSLQFVYINKRLVLKTRIHKVVNLLLGKSLIIRKRGRCQGYSPELLKDPTTSPQKYSDRHSIYVLNITCPLSDYDITFDPSKTLVEFKDWSKLENVTEEMVKSFLQRENLTMKLDLPFESTADSTNAQELPQNEDSTEETNGKILNPPTAHNYTKDICTTNLSNALHSLAVKRPRLNPGPVPPKLPLPDFESDEEFPKTKSTGTEDDTLPPGAALMLATESKVAAIKSPMALMRDDTQSQESEEDQWKEDDQISGESPTGSHRKSTSRVINSSVSGVKVETVSQIMKPSDIEEESAASSFGPRRDKTFISLSTQPSLTLHDFRKMFREASTSEDPIASSPESSTKLRSSPWSREQVQGSTPWGCIREAIARNMAKNTESRYREASAKDVGHVANTSREEDGLKGTEGNSAIAKDFAKIKENLARKLSQESVESAHAVEDFQSSDPISRNFGRDSSALSRSEEAGGNETINPHFQSPIHTMHREPGSCLGQSSSCTDCREVASSGLLTEVGNGDGEKSRRGEAFSPQFRMDLVTFPRISTPNEPGINANVVRSSSSCEHQPSTSACSAQEFFITWNKPARKSFSSKLSNLAGITNIHSDVLTKSGVSNHKTGQLDSRPDFDPPSHNQPAKMSNNFGNLGTRMDFLTTQCLLQTAEDLGLRPSQEGAESMSRKLPKDHEFEESLHTVRKSNNTGHVAEKDQSINGCSRDNGTLKRRLPSSILDKDVFLPSGTVREDFVPLPKHQKLFSDLHELQETCSKMTGHPEPKDTLKNKTGENMTSSDASPENQNTFSTCGSDIVVDKVTDRGEAVESSAQLETDDATELSGTSPVILDSTEFAEFDAEEAADDDIQEVSLDLRDISTAEPSEDDPFAVSPDDTMETAVSVSDPRKAQFDLTHHKDDLAAELSEHHMDDPDLQFTIQKQVESQGFGYPSCNTQQFFEHLYSSQSFKMAEPPSQGFSLGEGEDVAAIVDLGASREIQDHTKSLPGPRGEVGNVPRKSENVSSSKEAQPPVETSVDTTEPTSFIDPPPDQSLALEPVAMTAGNSPQTSSPCTKIVEDSSTRESARDDGTDADVDARKADEGKSSAFAERGVESHWMSKVDIAGRKVYIHLLSGNTSYEQPTFQTDSLARTDEMPWTHPMRTCSNTLLQEFKAAVSLPERPRKTDLSIEGQGRLTSLLEGHQEDLEAEDHSKWRRREEKNASEEMDQSSIKQLFTNWENPVSEEPMKEVRSVNKGQISSLQRSLLPCTLSKQMLYSAKVLGQVDQKFIPCLMNTQPPQAKSGNGSGPILVVIDQHAAHERIRLENLITEAYEDTDDDSHVLNHTPLVPPVQITLSAGDIRVLEAYRKQMRNMGLDFQASKDQKDAINIHKIPTALVQREKDEGQRGRTPVGMQVTETFLKEQADLLRRTGGANTTLPKTIMRALASQACHGAIKFGDRLTLAQCEALVTGLSECDLPFQCAHGRPSIMPLIELNRVKSAEPRTKPRIWRLAQEMASSRS